MQFRASFLGGGVCDLSWLCVTLRLRIVQSPCYGVQQADQRGFAYAALEERVSGEGAEGIVANFGIGGRGSSMDEP